MPKIHAIYAHVEYENRKTKERDVVGITVDKNNIPDVKSGNHITSVVGNGCSIISHTFTPCYDEYEKNVGFSTLVLVDEGGTVKSITSPSPNGENVTGWKRFERDGKTYYCYPAFFKGEKTNAEDDYANEPNEVTTSGTRNISIAFTNGKTWEILHTSSPHDSFKHDYFSVLRDLVDIDRRLIEAASNLAVAEGKIHSAEGEDDNKLELLKKAIVHLENSHEKDLVADYAKIPTNKVKHWTPRAIVDSKIKKLPYVNATQYKESANIYEHRVIKNYLEMLEKQYCWGKEIKADNTDASNQPETTIKTPWWEEISFDEIKTWCENSFCTSEDVSGYILENPTLTMNDRVMFSGDGKEVYIESVWYSGEKIGHPLQYEYEFYDPYYKQKKKIINKKGYQTNLYSLSRLGVKIPNKNDNHYIRKLLMALYLLSKFEELNKNFDLCNRLLIKIYGKLEIESYQNRNKSLQKAMLTEITSITATSPKEEETFNYFCSNLTQIEFERLCKKLSYACLTESEKFKKAKALKMAAKRDEIKKIEADKTAISSLINSKLFRQIPSSSEQLRPTNLFLNHPVYKRIFNIIRHDFKYLTNIKYLENDDDLCDIYYVKKLCDIYEIWCYIKLVSIFILEYRFVLTGNSIETLREYISLALDAANDNKIKEDTVYFKLKNTKLNMTVTLWYDFNVNKSSTRPPRRPDILMKIVSGSDKGDKELFFALDAKYKKYNAKDYYNDLFKVAANRYYYDLSVKNTTFGAESFKLSGAYILHPDNSGRLNKIFEDPLYEVKDNTFYGSNKTQIKKHDEYAFEIGAERIRDNIYAAKIEANTISKEPYSGYVCKIGSVPFVPSDTNKLKTLIQMIMEHFLGENADEHRDKVYRRKCWMCGAENNAKDDAEDDEIYLEIKSTGSNYSKYYMTCSKCNEFWVETHCSKDECKHRELGKHLFNYYATKNTQNDNSNWNVVCPVCDTCLDTISPPND